MSDQADRLANELEACTDTMGRAVERIRKMTDRERRLVEALRNLLSVLDEHATTSFGEAEDEAREALSDYESEGDLDPDIRAVLNETHPRNYIGDEPTGPQEEALLDEVPLPCDVGVPINGTIRKGCKLRTLLIALERRGMSTAPRDVLRRRLTKPRAEGVEACHSQAYPELLNDTVIGLESEVASKKYDVMVPNGKYTDQQGNEKTRWLNVGAVIENRNGNLNLILNAIPAPIQGNDRMSWMMNLFEPRQQQSAPQQQQSAPQQASADFDDNIPF